MLLRAGHHFVKHKGVRDAFHLHLVKAGKLSADWGRFYDELFELRLEADYTAFASFEPSEVRRCLERSRDLMAALEALID